MPQPLVNVKIYIIYIVHYTIYTEDQLKKCWYSTVTVYLQVRIILISIFHPKLPMMCLVTSSGMYIFLNKHTQVVILRIFSNCDFEDSGLYQLIFSCRPKNAYFVLNLFHYCKKYDIQYLQCEM